MITSAVPKSQNDVFAGGNMNLKAIPLLTNNHDVVASQIMKKCVESIARSFLFLESKTRIHWSAGEK